MDYFCHVSYRAINPLTRMNKFAERIKCYSCYFSDLDEILNHISYQEVNRTGQAEVVAKSSKRAAHFYQQLRYWYLVTRVTKMLAVFFRPSLVLLHLIYRNS